MLKLKHLDRAMRHEEMLERADWRAKNDGDMFATECTDFGDDHQDPHPDYPCRHDGRCQYAIDHGAEGLGHCPHGKCVMPKYVYIHLPLKQEFNMTCVSTGCALVMEQQPFAFYWGDLHFIGNTWVFYCIQAANRGHTPSPVAGLDIERPRIDVPADTEIFERNGVFVFARGVGNGALQLKLRYCPSTAALL